jgi:predicted nucleic acid-binding protein
MLTVDANVWVAAADPGDAFNAVSRDFLRVVAQRRLRVYLPAYARVEIACALARRRQNAVAGQVLAQALMETAWVVPVPLDTPLLAQALLSGTRALLRGADALYVATAARNRTALISWDAELIRRAGALTPPDWLAASP